jgi:hypothetical protein
MPHVSKSRVNKPVKMQSKQAKIYTSDPRFIARMARGKGLPIVKKYDVPYLGGYSVDGKKIYIDRHIKTNFMGKDISELIRVHECAEKALLDIFHIKYQEAHKIATQIEKEAATKMGINWQHYCDHLDPYIKMVSQEELKIIPPDLDLEPYEDEHDHKILRRLLAARKSPLQETKISLEYHDELNPKLWVGNVLKPAVREKLLSFAYAWADFAKIPEAIVLDIIMVGGNVNYNYTPKSDIDVHLIIDRNALGSNREFVDEYLQDKKVLWTLTHDVRILGIALEPYAQDNTDQYPQNQGVYSIKRNVWVQHPTRGSYDFSNDPALKRKVMFYVKMVNQIIAQKMDIDAVKDFKRKMREMRSAAISRGGEFSFENLVFKELRNRGVLDRLNKYENALQIKKLSL